MTVKECYALIGADFEDVMSRLLTEQRVSKFAVRFLDETTHKQMVESFAAGDIETAFRASHTLKGTAANLGFRELFETASDVCEDLRHGNPSPEIDRLIETCTLCYNKTIDGLKKYAAEKTD